MARLEFIPENKLIPYLSEYGFELVDYPSPEQVITRCMENGHVKEYSLYYIKKAKCNECSKLEKKEFIENFVKSKGYVLHNEYGGDSSTLKMTCENGHYRECKYSTFKKHDCVECANSEKLSLLIQKVANLGYEFIKYPSHARDIAIAYCPKGHIREAKIHNFLNFQCGECIGKNIPKNIKICTEVFNGRGFTLLETEYINCKTPMKYICTCGEIRYSTLDIILHSDINSCYSCKSKKLCGENHPNWKGGLSSDIQRDRYSKEYTQWRKDVFKRDNYTCQCCGKLGGTLNAHHIENFAEHEELRLEVSNGITMCKSCHDMTVKGSFHHFYGTRGNNIFQLQEYFDETRNHLKLNLINIEDIIYKDYIFDIDKNS